jgi:hypothetical protein
MNQLNGVQYRGIGVWAAILLAGLAWPAGAVAQPRQGPGSREPTRRPPVRAPGGSEAMSGTYKGYIVKYSPSQDSEVEDLLGLLSVKSDDKETKTLKVRVRRRDGLAINVGASKLDLETAPDVLLKGLYCSVSWEYELTEGKKKPTQRDLVAITLETMEVEGKVDSVGDDMVILKARPLSGEWPGAHSEPATGGRLGQSEAKLPPIRKIRLKPVENVTKYTNSELKQGDPGDFEPGQEIEATVVFGRAKEGMILDLRPPGAGPSGGGLIPFQPGGGRPAPPPPPPRGGGRRKPGGG